jgi:transcriptional regulator with XRE-family HTH domain
MSTETCDVCGKQLKPGTASNYDVTPFVGSAEVTVVFKQIPVLRCEGCEGISLEGHVIAHVKRLTLIYLLVEKSSKPGWARLIRRLLGLTQKDLAARMGVDRVTVAKWESGKTTLTPQQDLLLRAVATGLLNGGTEITPALASVRHEERKPTQSPIVLDDEQIGALVRPDGENTPTEICL